MHVGQEIKSASSRGHYPGLHHRCAYTLIIFRRLIFTVLFNDVHWHLTGSGWAEYQTKGTVCDIALPQGLRHCDRLPKPLFTPSTKAAIGDHDENIHPDKVKELLGERLAAEVEQKALALYTQASQHALERGIIIADTKFEFGVDDNGVLHLVDEVLTPDSSRFWPASKYEPGRNQESFDKQVVRDYLTSIQFNKKDPITLPPEVIQKTLDKYKEVYTMLTGKQIQ